VMIDTLIRLLPQANAQQTGGGNGRFVLVTLHRPSNVDDLSWLRDLITTITDLSDQLAVVFPVHPRTRQRLNDLGLDHSANGGLHLLEPLPYLEFIGLQRRAAVVITDSGGIQEETTFLGVPCLTVRENTERPITISLGTNQLVGRDLQKLRNSAEAILQQALPQDGHKPIPLWDGHAAERIARIIARGSSV